MKRPFIISAIIGLAIIVMSLFMILTGPPRSIQLPEGYFTPIIAFEFATTPDEIEQIFDQPDESLNVIILQSLQTNTRLDFLFLIIYGAFLFTFCWTCARMTGNRLFFAAAALALLAPFFDILENLQLLSIMTEFASGMADPTYEPALGFLQIFTWLKWGALALLFALLFPFFRDRGRFGRFLAAFMLLPMILGIVAFLSGNPGLAELFALSISSSFVLLVIFSITYRDMV